MRIFLLITLVMIAFASNSLLNRAGFLAGTDPMAFALWRVASGALVLGLLALTRRSAFQTELRDGRARFWGSLSLTVYLLGFTLSAQWVEAGVGALLLFGTVQLCLFAGALLVREPVPLRKWIGMGTAMAGLVWLLWPKSAGIPGIAAPIGAVAMIAGGIGWAGYTWMGRSARDALAGTAGNFLITAFVFGGLGALGFTGAVTAEGLRWAIVSGALTSGLGYALWFHVLPQITATTAGVAQLSVPVIAVFGGAVLLGERLAFETLLASAIVLGGIALATVQRQIRSSAS